MSTVQLSAPAGVVETLRPGSVHVFIDENIFPVGVIGLPIAMPDRARMPNGINIQWAVEYSGGNPAAVNIVLEGCFGVPPSALEFWFVIDTTTVVTGESRVVSAVKYPFIRLRVVSVTTGNDATAFMAI